MQVQTRGSFLLLLLPFFLVLLLLPLLLVGELYGRSVRAGFRACACTCAWCRRSMGTGFCGCQLQSALTCASNVVYCPNTSPEENLSRPLKFKAIYHPQPQPQPHLRPLPSPPFPSRSPSLPSPLAPSSSPPCLRLSSSSSSVSVHHIHPFSLSWARIKIQTGLICGLVLRSLRRLGCSRFYLLRNANITPNNTGNNDKSLSPVFHSHTRVGLMCLSARLRLSPSLTLAALDILSVICDKPELQKAFERVRPSVRVCVCARVPGSVRPVRFPP